MTLTATHEVLVAAKAYLLKYGWQQDLYGKDGGPRCMVGAVSSALGCPVAHAEGHDAAFALARVLGAGDPETARDTIVIPHFNDGEGRTLDEVIDAFDRAILATAPLAEKQKVTA